MPRVAADPSAYLDALREARGHAEAGRVVNAQELARECGATWRIVEGWIRNDADFPVLSRGSQGAPWRFELVPVLDHLIGRGEQTLSARAAREGRVKQLAGFGGKASVTVPAVSAPSSAAETADRAAEARGLNALADAATKVHRLKVLQGDYVRRDAVEALLADMMTTLQAETLAASAQLDPAGLWPAEVRVGVDNHQRTVLVTVRDRMDAALTKWARGAEP